MAKEKEYNVKFKHLNEKGNKANTKKLFTNLRKARAFAGQMFRAGDFISLTNKKGVALPI
tara:strand:+ start:172 stop:351 length:180 start_codon:yes stop_codon:yes gene_type:complete